MTSSVKFNTSSNLSSRAQSRFNVLMNHFKNVIRNDDQGFKGEDVSKNDIPTFHTNFGPSSSEDVHTNTYQIKGNFNSFNSSSSLSSPSSSSSSLTTSSLPPSINPYPSTKEHQSTNLKESMRTVSFPSSLLLSLPTKMKSSSRSVPQTSSSSSNSASQTSNQLNSEDKSENESYLEPQDENQKSGSEKDISYKSSFKGGSDVLVQFSPLVGGKIRKSLVTYISPHEAYTQETLQAGILLVAHTRADIRRQFINRVCAAAVERSALVYAIAPSGSINVEVDGVYKLSTHPTLSRRAILNALLRHGAHLLIFGTISTRDDVMALMDATYTGYHCVAEIYGESAHDVLSRLEAIGVDLSMIPQNLRIVVPAG